MAKQKLTPQEIAAINTRYKMITKKLDLTEVEVACFFGYSDVTSWHNATRKPLVKKGIIEIYEATKRAI